MFDGFREQCGIVGVFGHPEAANLVYLSLYALQHRGQEAAGIVSAKDGVFISHRDLGLVADVFSETSFADSRARLQSGTTGIPLPARRC
jgi:amidophosphoribosyltransferase